MKVQLVSCLALLSCAFAIQEARAQSTVTETFYAVSPMERKIGHQYRKDVDAAWHALRNGDAKAAERSLDPVLSYCDAQQRPGLRLVSVATAQEYDKYMAENATGEPTEWIDAACPLAYKMKGYIFAGARRHADAIRWLDKAIALAPYFADAHVERGFAFGQSGELPEALASYRHALVLTEAYPSAAHAKPLALRGIGWVLIEMGNLDAAQQAYEESLKIDPDNELAKGELEYIAQKRKSDD